MCGRVGALVKSKTVEALVQGESRDIDYEIEIFSLCLDPICEMAYFSADYGYLFLKRQIGVPLDFKEDSEDRYLCYCNGITKDLVTQMVRRNNNVTIKDIFKNRGTIIPEKCAVKNPFGYCCMPDVKRFMEDIITGRDHI